MAFPPPQDSSTGCVNKCDVKDNSGSLNLVAFLLHSVGDFKLEFYLIFITSHGVEVRLVLIAHLSGGRFLIREITR